MITKNCLICFQSFKTYKCKIKVGKGKLCSHSCAARYTKNAVGHYPTETMKQHLSDVQKGNHNSPNTEFKKGMFSDEKHPMWKGDKVGRASLHKWVAKYLGRERKCTFCGTTEAKRYEWANKSRKYFRRLDDWVRLCVKCHRRYDDNGKKAATTRRLRKILAS